MFVWSGGVPIFLSGGVSTLRYPGERSGGACLCFFGRAEYPFFWSGGVPCGTQVRVQVVHVGV